MSSHPLQMLKRGLVLSLLVLLLCPLNSRAQDICFDDATAARMIVTLEQAKISEQQLQAQAGGNAELQTQVDILRGTIKLYEDQIAVYKNMATMNQQMSDMKDKACAEQVKAATPTWGQNMQKYLTGAGVMGVLGLAAIFIL